MKKFQDFVYVGGQPVAGATVTVTSYPSGASATIYSDNSGTVSSNPLITDGSGFFSFYAADGRYTLTINKTGYVSRVVNDVLIEDPADGFSFNEGAVVSVYMGDTTTLPNNFRFVSTNPSPGGSASVGVSPYASGQQAGFIAYSSPDLTSAMSTITMSVVPAQSEIRFSAGVLNGGTFLPLAFRTNGDEKFRINTDGSVSLGGSNAASAYSLKAVPASGSTRWVEVHGSNGANPKILTSAGSLDIGSAVVLTGQTVGTTVGAAGGAAALPATPLGYLTTSINGTACKIPYYN